MKLTSTLSVLTLAALTASPTVALAGDNAPRAEAAAQATLGDAVTDDAVLEAETAPETTTDVATSEPTVAPVAGPEAKAPGLKRFVPQPGDDDKGVVDDDAPLALDGSSSDAEMIQSFDDGIDAQQAADDYLKATSAGLGEQHAALPDALTVDPKMPLRSTEARAPKKATKAAPDVASLQRALNANGATIAVDGKMGRATRVALSAFQKQHGLSPTGELTPQTMSALGLSAR